MNRDRAKKVLYMGSDFDDDKVNRISVDFMYQARLRDIERQRLLSSESEGEAFQSAVQRPYLTRLAEARYALLRNQADLYQSANRYDTDVLDELVDDFEKKQKHFSFIIKEPVYTPAEMKFIANTGLRNAWTCFKTGFWPCVLSAVIVFMMCAGWVNPIMLVSGTILIALTLIFYCVIYVPYTMKQLYVRCIVFPMLDDPRSFDMDEIAIIDDDGHTRRSLKSRGFNDAGVWHARALGFPSAWLGVAIGATCALICLICASIAGLSLLFQIGFSLVTLIVSIVQMSKENVLQAKMSKLRESLRS